MLQNLKLLLQSFRLLNVASMLLLLVGLRFYFWNNFTKLNTYTFERSLTEFFVLLLIVGLISSAGYLVNDIFDVKVDKVNKPKKKLPFTKFICWSVYLGMNIVAISLTNLFNYNNIVSCIILISVILLFFYSFIFQKLPLLGNLSVATLAGVIPALYYLFDNLVKDYNHFNPSFFSLNLISLYFVLGFSITFLRELVKDIEDIEGDKIANYKTFPVMVGVKGSQRLFYCLSILFTAGVFILDNNLFSHFLLDNYIYYLLTFIFLFISIYQVFQSNFSKASLFLKLTLFSGVLVLFIL